MNLQAHRSQSSLIFSPDGYIRLTFDALSCLTFPQQFAYEDPELCAELVLEGLPASTAGYCEWVSEQGGITLSVGWAWYDTGNGQKCRAPGLINSNVMLISPSGYDLGPDRTSDLLSAWIFGQPRQSAGRARVV